MTAHPKDDPDQDLHAGDLPKAEDRRKRKAEKKTVKVLAVAMAVEAVAVVTGKGRKGK